MNGMKNPLGLAGLPILGQPLNDEAIRAVEGVLAKLKAGELVNVAVVGEQRDGEMFMCMAPGFGTPIKLRGVLGTLATAIDLQILRK